MSWIDSPFFVLGGLLAGFVFGFLLQKGNVSRYAVIVGQFLMVDHTVMKIMFTAIVVGAIGVYGMLGLGLIDSLLLKPALLAANVAGGMIFGVGMVGLGYCPGTGVAALGEGSRHAAWGVLGMIVGAAIFTEAYPMLEAGLLHVGDYGKITLSDVSGVAPGLLIAALAAIAIGLFAWIESREAV